MFPTFKKWLSFFQKHRFWVSLALIYFGVTAAFGVLVAIWHIYGYISGANEVLYCVSLDTDAPCSIPEHIFNSLEITIVMFPLVSLYFLFTDPWAPLIEGGLTALLTFSYYAFFVFLILLVVNRYYPLNRFFRKTDS